MKKILQVLGNIPSRAMGHAYVVDRYMEISSDSLRFLYERCTRESKSCSEVRRVGNLRIESIPPGLWWGQKFFTGDREGEWEGEDVGEDDPTFQRDDATSTVPCASSKFRSEDHLLLFLFSFPSSGCAGRDVRDECLLREGIDERALSETRE